MSLLMDALRKAEETQRLQAEGASSATQDADNIQCEAPDFAVGGREIKDASVSLETHMRDSATTRENLGAEHSTTTESVAKLEHDSMVTPVGARTATVPRRGNALAHRSMSSFLLTLEPLAIAPHDAQSASVVAAHAVVTEHSEIDAFASEPFVETGDAGPPCVAAPAQVMAPFASAATSDARVDDLMAQFDNEFGSHTSAPQHPAAQIEIATPAAMASTRSAPPMVAAFASAKQETPDASAEMPRMENQPVPKAAAGAATQNAKSEQSAKPSNANGASAVVATSAPAKTTASPVSAAKILNAAAKPKNTKTRLAGIFAITLVALSAGGIYVYLEQQRLAMPMLATHFPPAASDEGETVASATEPLPDVGAVEIATESGGSPPASIKPPAETATHATTRPAQPIKPAHRESALANVTNTPAQEFASAPLPVATQFKQKRETSTPQPIVVTTAQKANPVLAAYAAFQQGDLALARDLYQSVLRDDGNNRDALLGSAAIALRAGDNQYAKSMYERVLRQWPSDQVAAAGLLNVLGESEPLRAESELKYLLSDQSDSAALHFVLGNVYVRQQRWADAEAEFFSAYRLDRNNADFAYNLAVCLDHLGQRSAALEHYQAAQSLAKNTNGNFDRAVVERRIALLGDAQKPGVAP